MQSILIWFIHRDAPADVALLSSEEHERVRRYRRAEDGEWFARRRAALRMLIGQYVRQDPAALRFRYDSLGQLFLDSPEVTDLAFSVSQTKGLALLAFGWNCRIGVDVERIDDRVDIDGVAREVFSTAEREAGLSLEGFYRTWTRKEALLKALGVGLAGQPRDLTTADAGEGCWSVRIGNEALEGWHLRDLDPAPGVCGALAVSRSDVEIVQCRWE